MELNSVSIIGFVAACCTTFGFFPQLVKIVKTKKGDDISFAMYFVMILGIILWEIYGLAIKDWPIIFANIVSLLFTMSILILKVYYSRTKKIA